jgi:hypothetical protein
MPPIRTPLAIALVCGLAACSGGEPPQAQLGAGAQAVTAAEQAGAMRYSPVEFQTARDKLNAARTASAEGDYERARRLAEQAQVDAELAAARARGGAAEEAARTVQQDMRALRAPPGVAPGARAPMPAGSGSGVTIPGSGVTIPGPGDAGPRGDVTAPRSPF